MAVWVALLHFLDAPGWCALLGGTIVSYLAVPVFPTYTITRRGL
jgi:hypothetical protein